MISGKAESGKDTVATELENVLIKNNYSFRRLHFADYLKFACQTYFDWDGKKDVNGRNMLQNIANNHFRKYCASYFADRIYEIINIFQFRWDYVIIPDLRFKNEFEKIKKNFNYATIRIERKDHENILTEKQRKDSSETELDNENFDFYINETDINEKLIHSRIIMEEIINGKYNKKEDS